MGVSHVDNDDIEDAIEDSTHELVSSEQIVARYETLIALWTHRASMTQQWPSLIISASAAVLAIVFGQKTPEQIAAIASWRNWGDPNRLDVSLGAGMPILVTGLLALPFVYGIYRSTASMESIAMNIMEIERERFAIPPRAMFVAVNRPPGWFGILGGCILSAAVGAVSVLYGQSNRFAARPDKDQPT